MILPVTPIAGEPQGERGMKYIRKPGEPFEAFQWFKVGDGPEGMVTAAMDSRFGAPKCTACGRGFGDHGLIRVEPPTYGGRLVTAVRVCPGEYVREVSPGYWEPASVGDFEAEFQKDQVQ